MLIYRTVAVWGFPFHRVKSELVEYIAVVEGDPRVCFRYWIQTAPDSIPLFTNMNCRARRRFLQFLRVTLISRVLLFRSF